MRHFRETRAGRGGLHVVLEFGSGPYPWVIYEGTETRDSLGISN